MTLIRQVKFIGTAKTHMDVPLIYDLTLMIEY